MSAPTVTAELKASLRRVKLGRCLDTLPERLALASTGGLGHAEFLELVLADEVTRREITSADRRARAAGLDPDMTLDRWDDTAHITYDRTMWNELCSLRFVESGHNAVIMGPVGVGKTFLATALGHAAVRRGFSVHRERCDWLLKRLRASRLDNSHDVEMRRLLRVDLLIIDLCRPWNYADALRGAAFSPSNPGGVGSVRVTRAVRLRTLDAASEERVKGRVRTGIGAGAHGLECPRIVHERPKSGWHHPSRGGGGPRVGPARRHDAIRTGTGRTARERLVIMWSWVRFPHPALSDVSGQRKRREHAWGIGSMVGGGGSRGCRRGSLTVVFGRRASWPGGAPLRNPALHHDMTLLDCPSVELVDRDLALEKSTTVIPTWEAKHRSTQLRPHRRMAAAPVGRCRGRRPGRW